MSSAPENALRRYRVVHELGRGGMGRVLLVEDHQDKGALRAMKWVDISDPPSKEEERHLREYRLLSSFNHPHILRVHDFARFESIGGQYYTCEHLRGPSLSDLIGQGPVSEEMGREILVQLLRAFEFIHSQGWVHGDIKPANVLLRNELDDGPLSCCLIDFGLVQRENRTPEKEIVGTVYYIPPERILGARMDRSGDLYSAGVLMFHLLTGQVPFSGNQTEILEGHIRRTPPNPRSIRPELSEEMDALIVSLLAKKATDRPESAGAVLRRVHETWGIPNSSDTPVTTKAYLRNGDCTGWEEAIRDALTVIENRVFENQKPVLAGVLDDLDPTSSIERQLSPLQPSTQSHRTTGMVVASKSSAGDLVRLRDHVTSRIECLGVPRVFLDGRKDMVPVEELLNGILNFLPETDQEDNLECENLVANVSEHEENPELLEEIVRWMASVARKRSFVVVMDHFETWGPLFFQLLSVIAEKEPETPALRKIGWIGFQFGKPGLFAGQWLSSSDAQEWCFGVSPTPLDPECLQRWLAVRMPAWEPPRSMTDLLEEESEGSPALLTKLLCSMVDEGVLQRGWDGWSYDAERGGEHTTPLVRRTRNSFKQLGEDERTLLATLEILGGASDPEWLRLGSGLNPSQVLNLVLSLQQSGWIERESTGNRYQFRYFFQRKAVRSGISEADWASGNDSVATWILSRQAEGGKIDDERLANHLLESGRAAEAVEAVRRAAQRAVEEGRILSGIRWLERIVLDSRHSELSEDVGILQELGDLREIWGPADETSRLRQRCFAIDTAGGKEARFETIHRIAIAEGRTGNFARAEKMIRDLLPVLSNQNDTKRIRHLLLLLGEFSHARGGSDETFRLLGLMEGLPSDSISDLHQRAREFDLNIQENVNVGRIGVAVRISRQALLELDQSKDDLGCAWCAYFAATRHFLEGHWDIAVHYFRLAAHQFGVHRRYLHQGRALMRMGEITLATDHRAESRHYLERAASLFRRTGSTSDLTRLLWSRGLLHGRSGEYNEAQKCFKETYAWAILFPQTSWSWKVHLAQAEIDVRCSRLEAAKALLWGSAHPSRALDRTSPAPWSMWGRLVVEYWMQKGEPGKALTEFDGALQQVRELGGHLAQFPLWLIRWQLLNDLGCHEEAERNARSIEELLTHHPEYALSWDKVQGRLSDRELLDIGDEELLARIFLARARDASLEGQWGHAVFHLEEALHHSRRARTAALTPVILARLAVARPKVFESAQDPASLLESCWKKITDLQVERGRGEILTAWADHLESTGDREGAAKLHQDIVKHIEGWSEKIPLTFDPARLARYLGVEMQSPRYELST